MLYNFARHFVVVAVRLQFDGSWVAVSFEVMADAGTAAAALADMVT